MSDNEKELSEYDSEKFNLTQILPEPDNLVSKNSFSISSFNNDSGTFEMEDVDKSEEKFEEKVDEPNFDPIDGNLQIMSIH